LNFGYFIEIRHMIIVAECGNIPKCITNVDEIDCTVYVDYAWFQANYLNNDVLLIFLNF